MNLDELKDQDHLRFFAWNGLGGVVESMLVIKGRTSLVKQIKTQLNAKEGDGINELQIALPVFFHQFSYKQERL